MQMLPDELAAELSTLRGMRESLKVQLHQFQLAVAATETDKCPDASILYKILKKINKIMGNRPMTSQLKQEPVERKKWARSPKVGTGGVKKKPRRSSNLPFPAAGVLALPPPPPRPMVEPNSTSQQVDMDDEQKSINWPTEETSLALVSMEELTSPQTTVTNVIWLGGLQWTELKKASEEVGGTLKIRRQLPCEVTGLGQDQDLVKWFRAEGTSNKLSMQLIPKSILLTLGRNCFDGVKSINFHFPETKTTDCLTKLMTSGCAGCVHFVQPNSNNNNGNEEIGPNSPKLFILLYSKEVSGFVGFIPQDQIEFRQRFTQAMVQAKLFVQKKLQWDSTGVE